MAEGGAEASAAPRRGHASVRKRSVMAESEAAPAAEDAGGEGAGPAAGPFAPTAKRQRCGCFPLSCCGIFPAEMPAVRARGPPPGRSRRPPCARGVATSLMRKAACLCLNVLLLHIEPAGWGAAVELEFALWRSA